MIIVEGPDGAGKTTLVDELTMRLGLEQGERSITDRDNLFETTVYDSYLAVNEAVLGQEPPRIWDRMFYSDPIYATIVRDEESRFSDDQYNHLCRLVMAITAPVIICLPPLEVVKANVESSHQIDGVKDNIEHIWNAYHQLLHTIPNHQLVLYDYTVKGSIPRVAGVIRNYLRVREAREYMFA